MTSDAKIGLLLGLIFIIVIAFIINGLPSLRGQTPGADLHSTTLDGFASGPLGVAEREQRGQQALRWEDLLDQQLVYEQPQPDPQVDVSLRDDIRYMTPLPQVVFGRDESPSPVPGPRITDQESPPVTIAEQVLVPPSNQDAPGPTRPAVARVYEVQKGDLLSTIAKKFYGPVEGNKLANIKRIFLANQKLLKSPDEIMPGQKLVIPPLAGLSPSPGTAQSSLPAQYFEAVKEAGKKLIGTLDVPPKTTDRVYTVKDGDSLWKIAHAELGAGSRMDEIAKLNAGILPDKNKMAIGLKLRLPAK